MKLIVVESVLHDVEALKMVLSKRFDTVVFIGYHEGINKKELQDMYDDMDGIITSIHKEICKENRETAILSDVILTRSERLSVLQNAMCPDIKLVKQIIMEFSDTHNICLLTNYEDYLKYYETIAGKAWKNRYVVKSDIKHEDEYMINEMLHLLNGE